MLVSLAGAAQKPGDLLKNAALRALFCEKLGNLMHCRDVHMHFTAGLLSSFDAIFEMPLPEVLKSLPLSDGLRNAVLKHEGLPGEAVDCVIAHERAEWDSIEYGRLAPEDIRGAYLTAIDETNLLWTALEM
jgi:EAL and modified HD-GYP domain-containing signal transduction protein